MFFVFFNMVIFTNLESHLQIFQLDRHLMFNLLFLQLQLMVITLQIFDVILQIGPYFFIVSLTLFQISLLRLQKILQNSNFLFQFLDVFILLALVVISLFLGVFEFNFSNMDILFSLSFCGMGLILPFF